MKTYMLYFVCLISCILTHQPLWVILCHPEKGRNGTVELVDEREEGNRGESEKQMTGKKQKKYL